MGAMQRVADRVLSVDGATTVSCFVGSAALDTLAPGLSKAFDPQLLQGSVRHGFHLAMARFDVRRARAIPSLGALAARLDAKPLIEVPPAASASNSLALPATDGSDQAIPAPAARRFWHR